MNDSSMSNDDEIDLRELSASLLAGWKTIAASVVICASAAVVYAINVEPTYEATAVFELKSSKTAPGISSQYAGLASMAGISLGGTESKGVFDRVVGRDFILRLSGDVGLEGDEYFNPKVDVSAFSLTGLKSALGLEGEGDQSKDASDSITEVYLEAVAIDETKNGSIEVSVTHNDANRAAVIANAIVARVVKELSEEEKRTQSEQLTYLSAQLADALSEMDATQKSVADFALANSLSSQSAFASRSELMFSLREDLRRTQEMARAVDELSAVMSSSSALSSSDYLEMKRTSPIIDDVDFRRLIGVPEALDAWSWPPRERLSDFRSTLADRMARIERSIADLRKEAELYATSTEKLATLQREATVAQATYNVLIEQVKAQSLITGYQGEVALFYQSATTPDLATSPKKKLIGALGIVIGAILGAMIAIISSIRSGKIYTLTSIFEASGATLRLKTTSLSKLTPNDLASMAKRLPSLSDVSLNELHIAQAMSQSKVVAFCATGHTISPMAAALWMALLHKMSGKSVAVLCFGEKPPSLGAAVTGTLNDTADLFKFEGVDILMPKSDMMIARMITSQDLHELLAEQDRRYDLVIVAATFDQTLNVVRSFARHSPFLVLLAKPAATLKNILEAVKLISPPHAVVSFCK